MRDERTDRHLVMNTTVEQIRGIARDFVENDLHTVLAEFLGPEKADVLFKASSGAATYRIEDIAEACLIYAQTATWDAEVDPQISMQVFEFWTRFCDEEFFNSFSYFDSHRSLCEAILSMLVARENLDPAVQGFPWMTSGRLDQGDLVLLSGLTPETVRQARYQTGEHRLEFIESGDLSENGKVSAEEARRWLQAKGLYLPPRIYEREQYSPQRIIRTAHEFKRFIDAKLSGKTLTFSGIATSLQMTDRLSFDRFAAGKGLTSSSCLNWLDPDTAVLLGKILNVSPKWLLQCALSIRCDLGEKEVERLVDPGPALPNQDASGFVVPSSLPITGDSIREVLAECPWVQPHDKHTKPNTKMDGYVSYGGVAFTHQHEVSRKQYFWLPVEFQDALSALDVDVYSEESIGINGNYGRHSGLRKYPELCDSSLIRVRVKTPRELSTVLEVLHSANG